MIKNLNDFTNEDELIETLEAEIEIGDWKSLKGEEKEKFKKTPLLWSFKKDKT